MIFYFILLHSIFSSSTLFYLILISSLLRYTILFSSALFYSLLCPLLLYSNLFCYPSIFLFSSASSYSIRFYLGLLYSLLTLSWPLFCKMRGYLPILAQESPTHCAFYFLPAIKHGSSFSSYDLHEHSYWYNFVLVSILIFTFMYTYV